MIDSFSASIISGASVGILVTLMGILTQIGKMRDTLDELVSVLKNIRDNSDFTVIRERE